MIWVYGGRFWSGVAGCSAYDARFFVNQTGAVVVMGNYRLGALGWLFTSDGQSNFGLLDQRQLMQWVQTNIKAFGGDPNRVSVFGESAGAISIGLHMASPGSANLFHAAIMESNPVGLPLHSIGTAKALALLFAKSLGCTAPSTRATNQSWIISLPAQLQRVMCAADLLSVRAIPSCLMSASIDAIVQAQLQAATHISIATPLQVAMPWSPGMPGNSDFGSSEMIAYRIFICNVGGSG